MTVGPGSQDRDEQQSLSWVRRLVLVLLVLLGSFGCMLLAAQVALLGLEPQPLRDVRSAVRPIYRAAAQRSAPLVPQVIDAVARDIEAGRATPSVGQLTVVPVVQIPPATPTTVAQITPTPTPTRLTQLVTTASATSSPTDTRAPTETPTRVPATVTAMPTPSGTPRPTETSLPTPIPTATFTSVPPTASPVPTATPLPPTETAIPTGIPTLAPTATPQPPTSTPTVPSPATDTSTPLPTQRPPDTDTPSPTDTPIPSDTPTQTPVPPPDVIAITPNATVQGGGADPDFDVDIIGQNFVGSQAWLGQNIQVNVLSVTDTLIDGTLSPNVSSGIYALTVQNSDGQQGVLPRAFTVDPRPHPDRTLDSGAAFISTFGPVADVTEGDDDHVQIVFYDVPDGPDDVLYVRVFDPDTGGVNDEPGLDNTFGDTTMAYSLRGAGGAYTEPNARSDHPGPVGIDSGELITQTVIGEDPSLDGVWLPWAVNRVQGELVNGRRVFKLVIQGVAGDDGNRYQATLSAAPDANVAVAGARTLAFSWCVSLSSPGDTVNVYPFVPVGSTQVTQYNFDFDVSPGSDIALTTPLRNLPVVGLSGNGDVASQGFVPFSNELGATWTARYTAGTVPPDINDFTLWFAGDGGPALAVYAAPTLASFP